MATTTTLGSNFSDYGAQSAAQTGPSGAETTSPNYWSLERLKRSYTDYLNSKVQEIEEQKDARRYRHGSQWTNAQIKEFNRRRQPIVTYNHIGPKINGVVGIIERLPHNPKGFPRTPKEEQGADIATHAVRYVLDLNRWRSKSPLCGEMCGVDGFAGIEIIIESGDRGDPDIAFEVVENDGFFYDPRSVALDFSDARFMGQGKWLDLDQAKEMFPGKANDLEDAMESATDLSTNSDRENKWFITDGYIKRIRVIDEWYKMNGEWCWCIYTGNVKLDEGKSYLQDEKGKSSCKYIMFSAAVDQDGDRYGFVRQFKSPQDEINQRRSKALHLDNSRRIMAEQGAFDDIEKARIESARPDGVVIYNTGFKAEFDDDARLKAVEGQLKFLQEAKAELDSYGPTLSMIGDTGVQLSGRAISLQQQAGVAQLGPFIISVRSWKLRVYRAIWNAIRQYWKAERWIRVTDDQNSLQFLGINQVGLDQMGMPAMVNQVSALDVDIIMDEGTDSINAMQDTYDAMVAIVQAGGQVPPDIIIELAPGIDPDTRKRLLERLRQPDPAMEQAKQIELEQGQADVQKTQAETAATKAEALMKMQEASQPDQPDFAAIAKMYQDRQAHEMDMAQQQQKAQQEAERAAQDRQMAIEKHQMDMAMSRAKIQQMREPPKEKEGSGGGQRISLDGTVAEQVAKHSKEATSQIGAVGEAMIKAAQENSQAMKLASQTFADSAQLMAKAMTAPKRIVRDKNGRASHVETIG